MKRLLPLGLLLVSLASLHAADLTFYVGTYTGSSGSKGIYKCTLDSETGKLGPVELAAAANSPSFLAITPDGKFLYAGSDDKGGSAIAFRVEKDGNLALLNQQVAVKGGGVAHIWYDIPTHDVLTASYGGGSIAAFQTKPDGSLTERTAFEQFEGTGPNKDRQEKPHAHSIYTDDAHPFVYACDLGTDKLWIFKLGDKGALTADDPAFATVPPGSGPRHLAFSPNEKYVYVANEMGHTVTAFTVDLKTGALTQFQDISALPAGFDYKGEMTTAEIFCHPSGKWLYVTNRDVGAQGHDSIAVYSIADDGKLTWIQDVPSPVKIPRGFALDPSGKWLVVAGQNDNKISPLKIDQETGKLTATDQVVQTGSPVCILFAPVK
jgi:6-phosphogluconolactonase